MANDQTQKPAQVTVTVRPQTPPAPEVVTAAPEIDEDDEDGELANLKSAAIEMPRRQAVVARKKEDPSKMVKIRPRQSLGRIHIGGTWYMLTMNKDCLVPAHVKLLLEQKGVI